MFFITTYYDTEFESFDISPIFFSAPPSKDITPSYAMPSQTKQENTDYVTYYQEENLQQWNLAPCSILCLEKVSDPLEQKVPYGPCYKLLVWFEYSKQQSFKSRGGSI